MDQFKTNICNALMKQSLTSTDNCLRTKEITTLKIQKEAKVFQLRASSLQPENPSTQALHPTVWHKFQHPNVNQILNLVLQGPTAFFLVKGFFILIEDSSLWILPLLIPASTCSPVNINSVNPSEELPIKWLKMEQTKCPKTCLLALYQTEDAGLFP